MTAIRRIAVIFFVLMTSLLLLDRLFPPPLADLQKDFSRVVLAADRRVLRAFPDQKGVWRRKISVAEVSPLYLEALINYEDRRFYRHFGVDLFSLFRAAWQAVREGRVVSGGSTLTMQVARLIEPIPRDFAGKAKQIWRALQLESRLSKTQILQLYLNFAPFGGPIEGVEAASQTYLGKAARVLSHAEAALLAVLPQAPSRLRPDRHPQRAQLARDKVLNRLAQFGVWSKQTVSEAKLEQVAVFYQPNPLSAPLLARHLKARGLAWENRIQTTIDWRLQSQLEALLRDFAGALPRHNSAAVLVVENKDLATRAYLGSADFLSAERFGHVDMIQAKRSPGSTLKPFLYGLAIEQGLVHSESLLADAALSFDGYQPSNFSGKYRGPVSVAQALQHSLNVPAVALLSRLSPKRFDALLRNGGLHLNYRGRPNLSLILGGASVDLASLVGAYRAFAAEGLAGKPRFTPKESKQEFRLLDPGAAWIVRKILAQNSAGNVLTSRQGRNLAWKTGTSYGFRDAWAIGVSDEFTVGVWVGRPDGTPSPGQYGAVTAVPLLFRVFDVLPRQKPLFSQQKAHPSVEKKTICWPLGVQPESENDPQCHEKRQAWILNELIPPTLPDVIGKAWRSGRVSYQINRKTGLRVDASCSVEARETRQIARWPLAVLPWLSEDIRRMQRIPNKDPVCPDAISGVADQLEIVGFDEKTKIRALPQSDDLPSLTLHARGGEGRLYWLVDSILQQKTAPNGRFHYTFSKPGEYRVSVFDEVGNVDFLQIEVAL